jgi:hypothetical protein
MKKVTWREALQLAAPSSAAISTCQRARSRGGGGEPASLAMSELSRARLFKGGTCLKKYFFETCLFRKIRISPSRNQRSSTVPPDISAQVSAIPCLGEHRPSVGDHQI